MKDKDKEVKEKEKESKGFFANAQNDRGELINDECCKELREKIEALESQSAEYLAGWKRALADYQNLLKDVGKEKQELIKFANGNLIVELLPILDNFKLALKDCSAMTDNAWVVGFAHIKKQLEDFLKENGVEEIKTVGEKFDPLLHEAVEYIAAPDVEAERIVEERRAGYRLSGRVIQAARVVVAR
jgi:molecular chaperone GrpE